MRLCNSKAWPLILLSLCSDLAIAQTSVGKGDLPLGPSVQSTLPDLGSSANSVISKADEYQLGRMMMRNLREDNLYFDDPETTEFLLAVGSRIAVEAQDGGQPFSFFSVRDNSINAFALPGGFIGINTGLITRANNESELAGVMAHEIGHVVQRHIARAYVAQRGSSLTALAGLLGAVLIGAVTGSADAGMGVMAISQGAAMQQQINFTRMEEHEADRVGISFLAEAGYDPNGMAGFFSTIMRQRGNELNEIPSLLLSHPLDQVRIAEARARVAAMPAHPRRPDSTSFPYIRERLRVLTPTTESDHRGYYEQMRKNDPRNPALIYGAALAELKSGSPAAAVTLLKALVNEQPRLTLLQIALAQAQYAAGQKNDAVASFERALAVSPRNVPLSVRYAETLLDMGRADKAHQLLLDLFNVETPTPEQVKLTAIVASAAGDTGDAYYYMSEYHIGSGDLMLATQQLDLALASPNLTDVQRKRFLARREEIRGYLREQRNDRSRRATPPG